ncbi:MAG: helix-turn-helix domain-containing protein [Candidatus Hydrogenedentes bacterium]|nr:helix-turn-helix domain-containing protein [Candidatus Hydrogenedentota bacterium]
MVRVELRVADPANRMTLQMMLQASGHEIVSKGPEVIVFEDIAASAAAAGDAPVLVLAGATQIRQAVSAMQKGVYGYIYLPLQPGEADIMVRRASGGTISPDVTDTRGLEAIETEHILAVLRQCKGNRSKAARKLGVGRNTLWRKLKKAGSEGVSEEGRK